MSGKYPTTVYRVSLKAVIHNEKGEVLVVKEGSDNWSLPGGGIDHGETDTEAMRRELMEEVAYEGNFSLSLLGVQTFFVEEHQSWALWIVYNVHPETYDFAVGSDATEVAFIDPRTLKDSQKRGERLVYKFCVDMDAEIN
jgi:8-oxo-dGTP pyrophosphatase MutT (NUDIX family)